MTLSNRREILFFYDVADSNPNGDPDDSNRPRIDENGMNIVTDVRLKRTIRDFWLKKYQNVDSKDVLVKRSIDDKEMTVLTMEDLVLRTINIDKKELEKKSKKEKADAYREILKKIISEIPKKFIDVRCFGAALTVKGANHSFTGPVQFSIGKSLNIPKVKSYTITTTFASGEGKGAGTFGEFHCVDYSLILFHGIACEYSAKYTSMTEQDLADLYLGLWKGTKMLNTRSKFNHNPRVIISIVSNKEKFQIGGLHNKIKISEKDGISSIKNAKIVLDDFITRIEEFKNQISKIEIFHDSEVTFSFNNEDSNNLEEILQNSGFNVEVLTQINM